MNTNGKRMTQQDLESLPEVENVVLWQPDDEASIKVLDMNRVAWSIGFCKGTLCKRKYAGKDI